MTRTPEQAIAWALDQTHWATGYCQMFVRSCYAVGSGFGSAATQWQGALWRHTVSHGAQVPRGVPVFWLGGSKGYGHVALSLGNGLCRSTDWPSRGLVGNVAIDTLTSRWGLRLVGWTEDMNNVRVWSAPTTSAKDGIVSLHRVQPGKKNKDILEVQRALVRRNIDCPTHSYYGVRMKAAVRQWQLRLGYRGDDADGVIGRTSLERLNLRVIA